MLSPNADPHSIALARETALALYQLGDTGTLKAGLGSIDPEVRRTAARSGASGLGLCELLKSARGQWCARQRPTAYQLSRFGSCLTAALQQKTKDSGCGRQRTGEIDAQKRADPQKFVLSNKEHASVRHAAIIALGRLDTPRLPDKS